MNIFQTNSDMRNFVEHYTQDFYKGSKLSTILVGFDTEIELNIGQSRIGVAASIGVTATQEPAGCGFNQALDALPEVPQNGIHMSGNASE